jgi:type II secretory pathway pseudopilin PulG
MAGSKVIKKGMLSGASIIEAVVAMVIIVVVFGIAMMIFANVTQRSLSMRKIRAGAALQNALQQAAQSGQFPNELFHVDDISITPEIKPVEDEPGLTELHLTAYDENQHVLAEAREIMINNHEARP